MGEIACSKSTTGSKVNGHHQETFELKNICAFQMPLHYPRYKKHDYEEMSEWKLDCLLKEYGLPIDHGDVNEKRKFAMGAFLWT
ncbi:hypothetical protein L1887_27320 [Cichorium endivia]|nr:hypothetical protein L1887_27320 [Cichorium endivia]